MAYKYIFNVFTGTLDLVNTGTTPPVFTNVLLLETGDFFLLEDGGLLFLED